MQLKKELKQLEINIDNKSSVPVYEQVKQGIKLAIVSGYLEEGDRLVPIRELASKLRVNPNTIVKVYYQLDVEGYIYSQPGSGYFVKAGRIQDPEETQELFFKITEDYISKALKLGYSIDTMIERLTFRLKETRGETGSGKREKDN